MNLNGTAALRHVLAHILHQSQSRFLLVSYLDDTHAIFLLNAQLLQGFAHDIHLLAILVEGGRRAAARHDVAMQIIEQLIFVYQVIKRFALLLFLSALLLLRKILLSGMSTMMPMAMTMMPTGKKLKKASG